MMLGLIPLPFKRNRKQILLYLDDIVDNRAVVTMSVAPEVESDPGSYREIKVTRDKLANLFGIF